MQVTFGVSAHTYNLSIQGRRSSVSGQLTLQSLSQRNKQQQNPKQTKSKAKTTLMVAGVDVRVGQEWWQRGTAVCFKSSHLHPVF